MQFCAKRDRTLQSGGSEPSKMHLLQDVPNLCGICEAIYKCHYTSLYNMVPLNSTCAIMLNSELQNMFAEDFGTTNDPGQIELAAAGGTFGLRAKALSGG